MLAAVAAICMMQEGRMEADTCFSTLNLETGMSRSDVKVIGDMQNK
jgi:hypothetical protein